LKYERIEEEMVGELRGSERVAEGTEGKRWDWGENMDW